jgi:type II secretory pathway pseudopilin PulG
MQKIRLPRNASRRSESGYMLLVLMLAVAVLTITMSEVARNYRRAVQRDKEVEMIHRGEQYARAIQKFYKKNHTYPLTLEQLENTNNIRYLRKRYKDPMSPDGEWKIAHQADIATLKGVGNLTPPPVAGAGGAAAGAAAAAAQATTTTNIITSTPTQGTGSSAGSSAGTSGNSSNPVFGGGPVFGVVSKMTTEGIHSFGDKTKYSEWFFVYIPTQDTVAGRLLVGPYNPNLVVGAPTVTTPTKSTSTGTGQTPAPGMGTGNPPATTMPPTTTPPPATTP